MENLENEVIKILIHKHKISGGHNGTYAVSILTQLQIEYASLRKILNKLYKEKKIIIRDGSKGKLIFPNVKKK